MQAAAEREAAAERAEAVRRHAAGAQGVAPPDPPPPPPPSALAAEQAEQLSVVHTYKVGSRVLARSPDADEDHEAVEAAAAAGWVPGRVLGTRMQGGVAEYKVSLDGYDSEHDEWISGDDERVRPYEVAADGKEAAKMEAEEKVAARLQSEARRHDARAQHEAALAHVS